MLNQKQFNMALAVFAALLFASFTYPPHFHPYRTYFQDAFGIFSVILCIGYMACNSKATLRIPNAVIVPLALIVVIAVQTWNGFILYRIDMVFPVIYLICFAIALICGATLAMQEDGLKSLAFTFAWTFILIGVLSVLMQQVQVINLDWTPFLDPLSFTDTLRPYANVAQPNLLALLLCFSLISVWFVYLHFKLRYWAAFCIAVLLLWGLALTQSRIAWIILPLFLIICWRQPPHTARVSRLVLILLITLFAGFIFLVPVVFDLLGIAAQSVHERAGQTTVRLILWQQAWQMSLTHPWFGVGWFQFGPTQVATASFFAPAEYSEFAHNTLLNFAAEIGWPLTLLLSAGVIYWIYLCCIRRWDNLCVRYIGLMLVAISVHSMVEFPLWHGFVLMPFGVMVGALHVERIGWENLFVGRKWLLAFSVTAAVLFGGITWDYMRVVDGFTALKWIQEGKKTGVGSIDRPEFTLFSQYYDYFHLIKIDVNPGMSKEDMKFLERVALRNGFTPILGRLAIAAANNGRPAEALQALIVIQRLDGVDYPAVYENWRGYAAGSVALYGGIFHRMPKPQPLPKRPAAGNVF